MIFLWQGDVLLTVSLRCNLLLGKLTQCLLCVSTCDNNARHYVPENNHCSGSGPELVSFGSNITCKDTDPSVISKENNKALLAKKIIKALFSTCYL
jgi:hypothetical protein